MTCTRCQRNIEDGSVFCRFCGENITSPNPARRLTRLPGDGKIAGICAGLATYLDLDVSFIRLGWVVLSIVPGFIIGGLIAYIAAWLLVPEGRVTATTSPTKRLVRSSSDRVVAGVCGGLAEYLHVDPTLVRLVVVILAVYPGAVIFGVLVYVAAWLIIPSGSAPLRPVSSTA